LLRQQGVDGRDKPGHDAEIDEALIVAGSIARGLLSITIALQGHSSSTWHVRALRFDLPGLRKFAEMRCLPYRNLIALSLMLTPPGAAIAGPFEDAAAAYKRKDYASAMSLWRSLAEQGDTRAQGNVGVMYSHGEGVPQDYAEALKWYRRAAEQGDAHAQYDASAGSIVEKIRSIQAQESARSQRLEEERNARVQIPPGPPRPVARIEPPVFRFSAPVMEQRTVRIGPPRRLPASA
jgi:hypothetical protein